MYQKKTKIVATLGPASEELKDLEALINHGVNVVRLNFSHGDHAEHLVRLKRVKILRQKLNKPIAILQDLGGPKIRIGDFEQGEVALVTGQLFTITTKTVKGSVEQVSVNYPKLPKEVKVGDIIFLDDGKKKLRVEKIEQGTDIVCRVLFGGTIKSRRGLNTPDSHLSISSLTAKDRKDVLFGIAHQVDYIAISFVRRASDIKLLRSILDEAKSKAKIVAKIETKEAVEALDEIIEHTDAVMIARGDLAVEIPAEDVPLIQKEIIRKCNKAGVSVITATQMLESMTRGPFPTRAEVNDVANAILDGTDAVMLSEETAMGVNPVLAVDMMRRIAIKVETGYFSNDNLKNAHLSHKGITDSFSYSAINMAHDIKASVIVALSQSGFTARMIARYRPHVPLIVLTTDKVTFNQLALTYACYPILTKNFKTNQSIIDESVKFLSKENLVKKGDSILVVAGTKLNVSGSTNLLFAHIV